MTSENDSNVGDDASSQEPVIDSTPTTAAIYTVTAAAAPDNMCEVYLIARRDGVALVVPCGHSQFCSSCADTVANMANGCPICRTPIDRVLRVFL